MMDYVKKFERKKQQSANNTGEYLILEVDQFFIQHSYCTNLTLVNRI